tara:strand:- start:7416 stop:7874 length:459 start_codon:yes stop_codon:yes gene_type:complete
MSQGIYSALTFLEDQIMSIDPKSDVHHGFVCHNRANGVVSPLDQRFNSTRYFELSVQDFPEDDGAAGLSGRRRARISCDVRYDVPQSDTLYLQRLVSEDADSILLKLKGPNYSLATTGILSVIPEPPIYGPIDTDEQSFVLSVPFTLLYLEA